MIAAIVSATLAALLARCATGVGPTTMRAIVSYESGARPFAIGDNTSRRSYVPRDRSSAIAIASSLLRAGHDIDVGYAQVNVRNFDAYGLDVARALDPCTNVAVGSHILRAAYARAARRFGPGQEALAHALSAYNTGGFYAGAAYARDVYATAARLRVARRDPVAFVDRTHGARRAVPFVAREDAR